MESRTITIEVGRETAVLLLWISAGVLLIGGTFLVTFDAFDHWRTVNATGLVSALYLGALVGHSLRSPVSLRTRIIGMTFLAAFIGTFAYGWRSMEETSQWQRWLLLDIRSTIGRGILQREILTMLESVQERKDAQGERSSLGRSFLVEHPNTVVGVNFFKPRWAGESLCVVVTELSDTAVTLTGTDAAAGWDPDFHNVLGGTGLVQSRYRLTHRGIEYGIDN